MNEDQAKAYLAAFIDGEGHIGCHGTSRGRMTKTVEFSNTDKQLFDRVVDIAASLGLPFRVYYRKSTRPKWSDKWVAYLAGGRPAFEKFQALIPLQATRKCEELDRLVKSYIDPEVIYAARRTCITLACAECGNPFSAFPADIARRRVRFCSTKCRGLGARNRVQKICLTCAGNFDVNQFRSKTAKFCSPRCAGLQNADRLRKQATAASHSRRKKPKE